MDLFEYNNNLTLEKEAPLAARMRPATLLEFIGQRHIVAPGKLLYRAIQADKLSSIILYGPPGTGKTTLAKIIAGSTKSEFVQINATTAGIKDIKETVSDATYRMGINGKRTILFIDEIHRFNKAQQDALLPHVENGVLILIGATTENPYFEVNKALTSRSILFQLNVLSKEDIKQILKNAITNQDKGLGLYHLKVEDAVLEFLSDMANGDARSALNAIELAALTTEKSEDGYVHINMAVAEECIQKRAINYDKNGDNHYDTISAFIKSMRGSDPDAAVYYLARMLYAGEDPKFIARRIVICASEDVGNADPHALLVASAAAQAVDFIGMPEARIILSQAATYIACAPKSNAAYCAINDAYQDVSRIQIETVPVYLKDSHSSGAKNTKESYQYPHNFPGHYVKQNYLPKELSGKIYYKPSGNGVEKKIKESLLRLRGEGSHSGHRPQTHPQGEESL